MEFLKVVSADWYKTKRTGNLLISIATPFVVTLFVFCLMAYQAAGSEAGFQGDGSRWDTYCQALMTFYVMLLPLLVAVISFSMNNIEHKNNGLKQIFTLPISKFKLYFSKVTILMVWIVVAISLAFGLLLLGGSLLDTMFPGAGFESNGVNTGLLVFFIRAFFSLTALLSIHFFLSIYWNNFIVSVGIACFMMVFALIAFSWEHSYLIPYCNLLSAVEDFALGKTNVFSLEIIVSLLYTVAFFGIGYGMMLRKSIK